MNPIAAKSLSKRHTRARQSCACFKIPLNPPLQKGDLSSGVLYKGELLVLPFTKGGFFMLVPFAKGEFMFEIPVTSL